MGQQIYQRWISEAIAQNRKIPKVLYFHYILHFYR